jgi:hypothetical protein
MYKLVNKKLEYSDNSDYDRIGTGGIAMNKSYEIEYCNLELRFDRRHIHEMIKRLIHEGFSLYWNDNGLFFIISIRTGRKLLKLRFQRIVDKYKIVGDYTLRDEKLAEVMERLIGDTRGHAIVKRFRDRQILIENIMFGKIIRMVEICGVEHKVIFQKHGQVTIEEMVKAFKSVRADRRIPVLRLELDYELARLHELLTQSDLEEIENCKATLEELRKEMLTLEM